MKQTVCQTKSIHCNKWNKTKLSIIIHHVIALGFGVPPGNHTAITRNSNTLPLQLNQVRHDDCVHHHHRHPDNHDECSLSRNGETRRPSSERYAQVSLSLGNQVVSISEVEIRSALVSEKGNCIMQGHAYWSRGRIYPLPFRNK